MQNTIFSSDQQDVLKELMNIAYGAATASIAELLDAFATLQIPQICVCDTAAMKSYIEGKINPEERCYVTKQLFNGELKGENLFLLRHSSAMNLTHHLYGGEALGENEVKDSVLELTNILSSATIGRLCHELNLSVQYLPPSVEKNLGKEIVDNESLANFKQIIIISTLMRFEDKDIEGELFILTTDETVDALKGRLDHYLENFF